MRRFIVALLLVACEATLPTPPTPTSASSPAPSASPPQASVESYGLALLDLVTLNLRTEEDADPLVRISNVVNSAVSPNGRLVAYWTTGTDLREELAVYDAVAGVARRVYALDGSPQETARGIVWSPNSDRIAFGVWSTGGPAAYFDPPAYAAIRIARVDGSGVAEILRRADIGLGVQAWSGRDRLVVREVPGGFALIPPPATSYLLREDGTVSQTSKDDRVFYGDVDDLERYAIRWDCAATPTCSIGIVRTDDVTDVVRIEAPAGERYESVDFRPRSSDLIAVVRDGAGLRVERWEDGGRGARVALGHLTIGEMRAHFLRPDGSAGVFLTYDSAGAERWSGDIMDLATGTRAFLDVPRGGYPIGSIRLTPGQRLTIDPAPPRAAPHIGETRAIWNAAQRAYGRVTSAEARLTTWAAANAWASLPAHVGFATHAKPLGLTDRVYLVVVRAPAVYRPRRGPAWRCSWYFEVLDAERGQLLEWGCPKSDTSEPLPPPLP